ncbi:unnamed protein product [Gordionus sp. m RMFG-2023]
MYIRLPFIICCFLNCLKHPNSLNLATKCCKINSTITNCICKFGFEEYKRMQYFECQITNTLTFPTTATNLKKYPYIYVLAIVNTTNLGLLSNKILISAGENVLELYLNHTGITSLAEATFQNYENLTTLDLSYNNIPILFEKAFKGLSSLTFLNLKNVNIKSIEHLVRLISYLNFQINSTIKIYSDSNPFVCNCMGLQSICMYIETMKNIKRYRNSPEDIINDFYTSLISSNCIMPENSLCMSLYHWLKGQKSNNLSCSKNLKNFTMNLTQCIITLDTSKIKLSDSKGMLLAYCVQEKKLNLKDNLSLIQIADTFEKKSLFMNSIGRENNMCTKENILKEKTINTKPDYLSIIENFTSPITKMKTIFTKPDYVSIIENSTTPFVRKMKTILLTARLNTTNGSNVSMTSIKYIPIENYTNKRLSSPLSSFINRLNVTNRLNLKVTNRLNLKVTNRYNTNISNTYSSVTFDNEKDTSTLEVEHMADNQKVVEKRLLGPKGIIIPLSSFILGLILPLSCFYLYVWVNDHNKVTHPTRNPTLNSLHRKSKKY